MPRRRDTAISEGLEELDRLEELYRGKPEWARIRTLQFIKQEPRFSIGEIAVLVGYSEPTIKRWLKLYRNGGLDALMQIGAGGRQSNPDEGLDQLKQRLMKGDFRSLSEVRRWMEHYYHSLEGKRYAQQVISTKGGDTPSRTTDGERGDEGTVASANDPLLPEHILRFLTSLPTTHKVQDWINAFRQSFQEFLGDVDRITMMLNVQCSIASPDDQVHVALTEVIADGERAIRLIPDEHLTDETEHLARLLNTLRRRKFPFSKYHSPKAFVFYYAEQAYLGVMILWRERAKLPISERTISTVERLRPFLILLFSDLAARHQTAQPVDYAFNEALGRLVNSAALTVQEIRVVTLQLLACSYEEIADYLSISVNTVRSHVKAIYEKTGTHGQAHFFAKYFTLMIDRPVEGK